MATQESPPTPNPRIQQLAQREHPRIQQLAQREQTATTDIVPTKTTGTPEPMTNPHAKTTKLSFQREPIDSNPNKRKHNGTTSFLERAIAVIFESYFAHT